MNENAELIDRLRNASRWEGNSELLDEAADALEAAGPECDAARAGIEAAREWWNEGNTNRTELGLILFENMQ